MSTTTTLPPYTMPLVVLKGIHTDEPAELLQDLPSQMKVENAKGSFNDELSLDQVGQKAEASAARLVEALSVDGAWDSRKSYRSVG